MIQERPVAVPESPKGPTVRWLPVGAIAFILIALNTGWIANSEMKTAVTEITISSLFIGVTFFLFVITLLNLAVRRLAGPTKALNQVEMMMLYSLLSISSVVAGVGHMGFFTPFLTNPFWYDSNATAYHTFWHLLPSYIGPRDPAVLKGYYVGNSTFFQAYVMRAWTMPLVVWGTFFLILLWTTLCLAAIVRRRWADEEHLPFPIVALPLEMTRDGAPIYRRPLLWIGFAIPAFLHSLNSIASIVPGVPSWPINTAKDFTSGLSYPYNGIGPLFQGIHPAGVGFGFLINTDVLFSLWFFYLFRKLTILWGVLEGWREPAGGVFIDGSNHFPYIGYQAWGAWVALGLVCVWQGRSYFFAYFRRALKGDPDGEERCEPMSARMAVFGFVAGFLALCVFVWSSGGSWWLPVLFFVLYVLIILTLSRLQAETAVLSPYLVWVDPQSVITGLLGTSGMPQMDTVHLGMMTWFNSDYRAASLPHQLQAFVGQDRAGGSMRGVPVALMLAAAVALIMSLLWDLQLYYVNGATTGHVNQWRISEGSMPWESVLRWMQHPEAPHAAAWAGAAVGVLITILLTYFRSAFTWFPLAPAAYVLNVSWANDLFWLDMLIAWVCKATLLRYGGMKVYKAALPFFLGLILGDFVTGSIWSLVGTFLKMSLFRTFST